ncbi:phage tail tip lysozyme [Candidatus Enterococcus ikei]|uniref:C40 family peptidase n=1 Tax=Candidatus Enterococcus ikei TaxID=2815326 RepID=A0ABS3H4N3_9ENTE|nr:phage tail tip lysozyme [Enterococcus sp. DIV0869a]MBO0441654.1 C40 family peptidase [Enterococcus sp. DIV0869a]
MSSIETAINWMDQRKGKATYSQPARLGPNSYDCSSAVYYALIAAGVFSVGTMGNTDTLFGHLEGAGWQQVSNPQRGDVFIWGIRGASGGDEGHAGLFVDSTSIIHCNSFANGISVDNHASRRSYNGNPPTTFYRNPKGSSGGSTPEPEITSEEERRAWSIAQLLNKSGYNMISIAGLLGNIDVETGGSMNPDTDQTHGGPAYGLVQWDGSAYPLVGSPTSSGREYVQRLLAHAGINGNYTSVEVQTRLIDWCMFNGQWIGVVEPKSVEGFKNASDVEQATVAFLKNFERAGTEHLQRRLDAAKRWHTFLNKLPSDLGELETFETMTNVGSLDFLGIKEGEIHASGWHFSSDKGDQYIVFINAETDQELGRVKTVPIDRPDVKEAYPKVIGVEKSGFEAKIKVPNGTAVYIKGIRTNESANDELIFDQIIIFEQAFDVEIDPYAKSNTKFFFEILENGKVIKRGTKILNTLSWSNELMYVPTTQLNLPIEYTEWINGREEIKLYINRKVFHGIVTGYTLDKENETLSVDLAHVVSEWEYRQVSTNLAAKNRTVNDIYSTLDFRYPGWNVNYRQDSAMRVIDYVYSRQNKLEGLTKTCELTPDLFWRVGFHFGRALEIGSFGEKKSYIFSTKPSGKQNIRIIAEPTITHNFDHVVNIATVYGEKSDSGMSSMSLREIYENKASQNPKFPVVILRKGINNERGYDYIQFSKLAPNGNIEYSVIDTESIALESAKVIEGAFSFNDLAPFNTNDKEITDEDRAKAAKTAYDAAVKKLKQSRRTYQIELTVEELPEDINVGDKVRLLYDNQLLMVEECSNYMKKILKLDDWFYITSINYAIDQSGVEQNSVVLEKFLKVDRESGQ